MEGAQFYEDVSWGLNFEVEGISASKKADGKRRLPFSKKMTKI